MKKILIILLILIKLICPITALAQGDYSDDYTEWNQYDSAYSLMNSFGCKVVAQAKLFVAAGIVDEDDFNPDIYYEWLLDHNYMDYDGISMYTIANKEALSKFAKQYDAELEYVEEASGRYLKGTDEIIWNNIEKGYYTVAQVKEDHWMLIDNETSLEEGVLYGYESATVDEIRGSVDLSQPQYAFITLYTYRVIEKAIDQLDLLPFKIEISTSNQANPLKISNIR